MTCCQQLLPVKNPVDCATINRESVPFTANVLVTRRYSAAIQSNANIHFTRGDVGPPCFPANTIGVGTVYRRIPFV